MRKEPVGILVMSGEHKALLATGVAAREDVRAALAASASPSAAAPSPRGLFTVEAGGTGYAVVATGSRESSAFILFERAGNDVLFDFAATVDSADEILRHLLTNPYEALTVVDRAGILRFVSPVHERFLGLDRGAAVGRFVGDVIENTRLHEVARTGKAEIGQLQEMRGTTRVVSRMPVFDDQGNVVAAIGQIMFKGPEQLKLLSAEIARLRSELSLYQRTLSSGGAGIRHGLDRIIGQSKAIRSLKEQIARVAPLNVPVLLVGESGTGKELVAHALHLMSKRRDESLVMVNAAAIPASLVESELFGYEAGAFTGAERKGRRGKFEQAHQGTLFFDEIGDMPVEMQVKLLRVLQDGSFERVGGDKPRISNFRLVSASNRDFQDMMDRGDFRLDLFYRISSVTLRLPPLRERLEDVELLANQALYDFAVEHSMRQKKLGPNVVAFLQAQNWPGNVRQLMHAVETAAIFADTDVISVEDFQAHRLTAGGKSRAIGLEPSPVAAGTTPPEALASVVASAALPVKGASMRDRLTHVEEQLIRDAMKQFGGEKKRVARELGISRSHLYKRLESMGL